MSKFGTHFAGFILAGAVAAGQASGQSASPAPTPTKPILARAVDGSWTVTFKRKNAPPPSKPAEAKVASAEPGHEIVSLRIEKLGKTYHAIALDAAQGKTETWSMNGVEVSKPSGAAKFGRVATNSPSYLDFSKADFDELSWIDMDNYKGMVDGPDGSKQFVFDVKNAKRRRTSLEHATDGDLADLAEKLHLVSGGTDKKKAEAIVLESQYGDTSSHALLDVLTQLPVEYDDGTVIRTYSFSEAPVPIPPDVIKLMQSFSEQIRKSTVPAPPP